MKKYIAALLLTLSTIALGQSSKYPSSSGGGSGTVTSVTAGSGLSGGTITDAGTINLITPVAVSNGGTGAASASAALTSLGAAAATRAINTTAPLSGGGNLTADRTLSMTQATGSVDGWLSHTDWSVFNNKAASGANSDITSLTAIGQNGVTWKDAQGTPNTVTVSAPSTVNTSYQLYWPVAQCGANQILQMDAVGSGQLVCGPVLSSYDTIVNRNLEIDSLAGKTIATWVCDTNISLSGTQTCDGVSIAPPSPPVLVIGETDATLNGLYCAAAGAWTRCGHMPDNAFTAAGAIVTVATGGGTNYEGTVWFVYGDGTGALHAYQIPVTHSSRRPYNDAGSCTISSTTLSTTATNLTCTGVPASAAVAVNCSGNAAFSTPTAGGVYCRATGSANQIACNTAVANTQAMTFACSWVKP